MTTSNVREGALSMLPFLAGLAPFALVIGATAAEQGAPFGGWAGSWLVYGGSAQLAVLHAVTDGLAVAVLTGVLVNARMLVYSASLAQQWRDQPVWFRAVAAAMVVEPTWAASQRHAERCVSPRGRRAFFLSAGVTLGIGWSVCMAVGALAGARFGRPELTVAVSVCLAAMIGPSLARAGGRASVVVGALVALLTTSWPSGSGLLAATVAGGAAGALGAPASRPTTVEVPA
jgi:predicted branched-subunit amino acid permease